MLFGLNMTKYMASGVKAELTYHCEEAAEDPDEDGEVDAARGGQHARGRHKYAATCRTEMQ